MNTYYAITYGGGTYGSNVYSANTTTSTSTGSSSSGTSSGALVDTGTFLILIVSIAALLLFVALIVRFVRKPKKAAQTAPEQTNSFNQPNNTNV